MPITTAKLLGFTKNGCNSRSEYLCTPIFLCFNGNHVVHWFQNIFESTILFSRPYFPPILQLDQLCFLEKWGQTHLEHFWVILIASNQWFPDFPTIIGSSLHILHSCGFLLYSATNSCLLVFLVVSTPLLSLSRAALNNRRFSPASTLWWPAMQLGRPHRPHP